MSTRRSYCCPAPAVFAIAMAIAGPAAAQPADPVLAGALQPGSTVWILTATAPELKVRVVDLTPDSVVVTSGAERETVAFADIVRVRARRSDSLINGMAIGAGAAIGAGLTLCRTTESWRNCLTSTWPIIRIGLVGAGIGAGIDALIRPRRTVFETGGNARFTVAPVFGRQAVGATVQVRWP